MAYFPRLHFWRSAGEVGTPCDGTWGAWVSDTRGRLRSDQPVRIERVGSAVAHWARQVTQLDPIGLAGGLNSYGFAAGDPINFSDPFGLCTLKEWTTCRVWSASIGIRFGLGMRSRIGPAAIELGTPSVGVASEVTVGARGAQGETGPQLEGWSASGQLGELSIGTSTGGCDDMKACETSVGGDVEVETTVGVVRIGAAVYAREAVTLVAGATRWALEQVRNKIRDGISRPPKEK